MAAAVLLRLARKFQRMGNNGTAQVETGLVL
jgi:hypothetical protein